MAKMHDTIIRLPRARKAMEMVLRQTASFSKVSALVHSLYKRTIERTFENLCLRRTAVLAPGHPAHKHTRLATAVLALMPVVRHGPAESARTPARAAYAIAQSRARVVGVAAVMQDLAQCVCV